MWECGIDLARYLAELWALDKCENKLVNLCGREGLSSSRALELGCGHGLPGIVAAMAGMQVHFQACHTLFAVLHWNLADSLRCCYSRSLQTCITFEHIPNICQISSYLNLAAVTLNTRGVRSWRTSVRSFILAGLQQ